VSLPHDRSLPLSPDDVERRGFAIEHRGYDRDQVRSFLYEVAAALRLALQGNQSPIFAPLPPWTRGAPVEPAPTSAADPAFEAAARILRAASVSATIRQEEADAAADAIVDNARQEAAELVRRAEGEAEQQRDRARRVLVAAQEEARTLVDDAERRARRVLSGARQDALNHAQQVSATLETRANQLIEAEQTMLARLNETRLQLSALIEELAGAEPVVGPTIEILHLAVDARTTGEPSRAAPARPRPRARPAPAGPPGHRVARMVRSAVTRAMDAALPAPEDLDVAPTVAAFAEAAPAAGEAPAGGVAGDGGDAELTEILSEIDEIITDIADEAAPSDRR
jgi:DivIVA domain-containing protein